MKSLNQHFLILFSTLAFAFPCIPTRAQTSSFHISQNHRYIVDGAGNPFLMQGDAAWSLIARLSNADVELYLKNRQAKGFNAIVVNLLEHKFSENPPRNHEGELPFADVTDWSSPNEKYFAHADWVIRKAAEHGITVFLAPVYLGYKGTDEGFYQEILANSPEHLLEYGRFLGKRYKDYDNIVWVMGGDRDPGPALEKIDLIAFGIRENDKRHLFTAHCEPEEIPADTYGAGWLDIGNTYTYGIVHSKLLESYNLKPVRPTFLMESTYEGEHNASEEQIRRQAYWAILCGGFGQVIGNRPIWLFDPGWQRAMDAPGSLDMIYWGRLFRSRAWFDLVPDQQHEVVTSGLGEFTGLDYLSAAGTSDGGTIIAYMPTSRTITVDLTKVSGGQAVAWWFNPRNGEATLAGKFPTTGMKKFTPSAPGDWVLVLDDASKQLLAPGAQK
jgi:hypothetical protein